MVQLRKKKLEKEKGRINPELVNSIKLFLGLVVLVACFVSVVLYIPSIDKKNVANKDSKYGTDTDDKVVDTSGLSCSSDLNQTLVKTADKVAIQYSLTEKQSDEKFKVITEGWDEEEEEEYDYFYYAAYKIELVNLTENLKAVISNNTNAETYTVTYDDTTKGVYSFVTTDVYNIITYSIKIYSAVEACGDQLVRSYDVTLPIYNVNATSRYCAINPETDECAQVTYDKDVEAADFDTIKESEKASKNEGKKSSSSSSKSTEEEKWYEKVIPEFTVLNVIIITAIIVTIIMISLFVIDKISQHRMKVRNEKL